MMEGGGSLSFAQWVQFDAIFCINGWMGGHGLGLIFNVV